MGIGSIKPGEVRNPKGTPNMNIGEISKTHSTGPRTDIGKLKSSIMSGFIKGVNSPLLNKFRFCNKCPLGEKIQIRYVNNKEIKISIPAKCSQFKRPLDEQTCVIDSKDHVKKLKRYFEIGEKLDTVALQESLTYQMLEDAEINREVDLLEKGKPGYYVHKFTELAKDNLESLNKVKFGEKTHSTNINVDFTEAVIAAHKKRLGGDEEDD